MVLINKLYLTCFLDASTLYKRVRWSVFPSVFVSAGLFFQWADFERKGRKWLGKQSNYSKLAKKSSELPQNFPKCPIQTHQKAAYEHSSKYVPKVASHHSKDSRRYSWVPYEFVSAVTTLDTVVHPVFLDSLALVFDFLLQLAVVECAVSSSPLPRTLMLSASQLDSIQRLIWLSIKDKLVIYYAMPQLPHDIKCPQWQSFCNIILTCNEHTQDWPTQWLTDSLFDWLTDRVIEWQVCWSLVWLTDWLTDGLTD